MTNEAQAIRHDIEQLASDAHALMTATSGVAGEKIAEARERLSAALQRGKAIASRVKEEAIEGGKAVDQAVQSNPYKAVAIGVGFGALLGFLVSDRCSRSRQ